MMFRPYEPYIPETIGEIMDLLATMMLYSPTLRDPLGQFPEQNIDTEFFALNEGLKLVRKKLGDERYSALVALSDRVRALFEADPKDETGETAAGRELILEMEDLLIRGRKP